MTDFRAELVLPTITPHPGGKEATYEKQRLAQAARFAEVEKMMTEAGVTYSELPSINDKANVTETLIEAAAGEQTITLLSTQELAQKETTRSALEELDEAPRRSGFSWRRIWAK